VTSPSPEFRTRINLDSLNRRPGCIGRSRTLADSEKRLEEGDAGAKGNEHSCVSPVNVLTYYVGMRFECSDGILEASAGVTSV